MTAWKDKQHSQVALLVALRGIGEVGFDSHTVLTGSNPVLTTSLALQNIIRIFKHK